MPRLRQGEREQDIGMLAAETTQIKVANHFNVSRMNIARLKTRLRSTGTIKDRPEVTATSALFIPGIDL